MELSTAVSLLRPGINPTPNQYWYDLGAGAGLFTRALASLISNGNVVAVDKDVAAMRAIPDHLGAVKIEKVAADFGQLSLQQVDGILMANSLHFIKDKATFLKSLRASLKEGGKLLVVEYEMTKGNQWVPYPLNYDGLARLAMEAGFGSVKKIGTAPSRYQGAGMYSAMSEL